MTEPQRPSPWRRHSMSGGRMEHILSAVGVFSAAVIVVCLNVLVTRHYTRWDWSSAGLYTLSDATRQTLDELGEPVAVIVLLSRSDPLYTSVEQLLETYGAQSAWVRGRFVDPDRQPGEFMALQRKYDIVAGRTQEGRVVTDAVIVIARDERHWYITPDDIVTYDEEQGEARPQLERALTSGIRQVLEHEPSVICFTTGHEEISIDDVSPTGLAELSRRLEKDNYEVRDVALGSLPLANLDGCSLVVVAAPDVVLAERAATHLVDYLTGGGNLLVLSSAGLDEHYRVRNNGLQPIARAASIQMQGSVVVEGDAERRLPNGFGETFLAEPAFHPITRGLMRRSRAELRTVVTLAHPLERLGSSSAAPLLTTSRTSYALRDLSVVMSGKAPDREGNPTGPFTVAMAAELPSTKPGAPSKGPRIVIAPASIGFARNWNDPALLGTRRFAESVISWLSSRPMLMSIPDKATHPVGLALTEASLGEVWRYVLLYMPGSAILLGLLVLYRRRAADTSPPGPPRRRRRRAKVVPDHGSQPPPGKSP